LTSGASKTDAGIREVELLLALRDELAAKSPKEGPRETAVPRLGTAGFEPAASRVLKRLRHSLRNPPLSL
jgi:hypothetical protein